MPSIAAIGTWPFSKVAVDYIVTECGKVTTAAVAPLGDILVSGIEMIEADKDVHTVGIYSYPNLDGVLQLDAAFIDPGANEFGAVLGIEGFFGAIKGARILAAKGPHSVLCGDGAERYMASHGIVQYDPKVPPIYTGDDLGKETVPSHDTVGIVALCKDAIVVGCSTSGMRNKYPGRVGDSAIFGCGLYAAVGVGGAAGTGDGDIIIRIPFSFIAVEAMRDGKTPQEAAEFAIDKLSHCPGFDPAKTEAAIVVLNMNGEHGSASTAAWKGIFEPTFASVTM